MVLINRNLHLFWIKLSYRQKWGLFFIGILTFFMLPIFLKSLLTSQNIAPQHSFDNFDNKKRLAARLETYSFESGSESETIQINYNFVSTIVPRYNIVTNDKEDTEKVCQIPKLIPGNKEIYDLDYQQFHNFHLYGVLSQCIRNNTSDKNENETETQTDPGINPTMFTIDFESNLVQLNKEHIFWNEAKCFYKSKIKDLNETLYVENNSANDERGKTIINDKTKLNETTEHIYIWCESTKNGDTIYEDILSQVPILPKVEERVKDLPANLNPEQFPSILVFGQDSPSHMNFRRYMPKVHDFLVDKLEAIEFNGFISLGRSTRLSIGPFCIGKAYAELEYLYEKTNLTDAQSPNFIWTEYGKMGYRTSYGEDCASDPIFSVNHVPALVHEPVDYDFRKVTRNLEQISLIRHNKTRLHFVGCYGPRLTFDVILENLYRTANTFARRNKPYWHFSWTSELTHDCNYYSKFGEEYLLKTLEKLYSNQLLNNTILILLSDHGMRYGQLRQQSRQGFLEERLPILYVALPKNFKERYPSAYKNMLGNTEKLITAFDLHATMEDILNLKEIENINRNEVENNEKSVSLFRKISNRRTCDIVGVPPEYCPCTNRISISVENSLVKIATELAINDINTKLMNYSQCHQLELESLTNAYRLDAILSKDSSAKKNEGFGIQNGSNTNNVTRFMHEIGFKTSPGGGEFYALVVPHMDTIKLIEIQRFSAYGNDGYCVNNIPMLKPFCHCKA